MHVGESDSLRLPVCIGMEKVELRSKLGVGNSKS